jgi:hypothetical protein
MILEDIEGLVELLQNSNPADYETNNLRYCKIMDRLVNPRNLKSLTESELVGIHAGLCWLSMNSSTFSDVIDEELVSGGFEFDDDGNNLFVVLDSLLSQESFPLVVLDHLVHNPEMLYCGFNEPDWVAIKKMPEKLFLRLWSSLEDPFQKGYRQQMIKNPHLPDSLKGLNWWDD